MLNLTALLSKNVSFNAYIIFLKFHFLLLENQAVCTDDLQVNTDYWNFLKLSIQMEGSSASATPSPSQTLPLRKPAKRQPLRLRRPCLQGI